MRLTAPSKFTRKIFHTLDRPGPRSTVGLHLPLREVVQDLSICTVQIQPRKHVLDHPDYTGSTRQPEPDTTVQDREQIFPERFRSASGNRITVRGVKRFAAGKKMFEAQSNMFRSPFSPFKNPYQVHGTHILKAGLRY